MNITHYSLCRDRDHQYRLSTYLGSEWQKNTLNGYINLCLCPQYRIVQGLYMIINIITVHSNNRVICGFTGTIGGPIWIVAEKASIFRCFDSIERSCCKCKYQECEAKRHFITVMNEPVLCFQINIQGAFKYIWCPIFPPMMVKVVIYYLNLWRGKQKLFIYIYLDLQHRYHDGESSYLLS